MPSALRLYACQLHAPPAGHVQPAQLQLQQARAQAFFH
eukprot:COSAG01_NODE_69962_length_260_cov_0.515528_1_plen_37_part_01